MEEEIWKDIYYYNEPTNEWVDYRGLYQVSNLGRVRRLWKYFNKIIKSDRLNKQGYCLSKK